MITILMIVLWIVAAAASWFLIIAFKKGIGWGFAVLFLPFVPLIFARKFWSEVKKPFLISISASLVAGILLINTILNTTQAEQNTMMTQLAKETMPGSTQKTLTEDEKKALIVVEKMIAMIEKLPKDEKQQQFLKVLKQQVQFSRRGLSEQELLQFKQDLELILKRTDLNKNQRQDFETMLKHVRGETGSKTVPVNIPAPDIQQAPVQAGLQNKNPMVSIPAENKPNQNIAPQTPLEKKDLPAIAKPAPEHRSVNFLGEQQSSKGPRYKRVSFAQVKNHIGSPIVFKGPRGREQECFLVRVADKKMHCTKHLSEGTFSFSFEQHEVKSLKVRLH